MSTKRIAIVGASGLVGATLVERLVHKGQDEVLPLIHSSGSAWRLTRLGLTLKQVELLDRPALTAALTGCTHVVNCTRGGDGVMLQGFKNLLEASAAAKVQRVVHLSSVMVYGDPPHLASVHEDAPALPAKHSYGWVKLKQDEMLAKAAAAGLSAISLCPPNIGGPYSYYYNALVGLLQSGSLALLDEDPSPPCVLVDVGNLCHAIELALDAGPTDGRRLFITDSETATWKALVAGLAPLAGIDPATVPRVSRQQILAARPAGRPAISLKRSVKHLISSDVRQAMRKDPLWERVDQTLRNIVARMGSAAESRVRLSVEGPLRAHLAKPAPTFQYATTAQQLRGVAHSCERARQELGYVPPYSLQQSIAAYGRWYRSHHGVDTPFADLIAMLA
ncbi:MAG: NAD-dependent epimerase/dehydratase family protein [Paucibacter sp.]|nr:NAD-dependent epimerase/dehydratase family protein [Roseateles sp.]